MTGNHIDFGGDLLPISFVHLGVVEADVKVALNVIDRLLSSVEQGKADSKSLLRQQQ